MNCPLCRSSTRILETRRSQDGRGVHRRRICLGCAYRFYSVECFDRGDAEPVLDRSALMRVFNATAKGDGDERATDDVDT